MLKTLAKEQRSCAELGQRKIAVSCTSIAYNTCDMDGLCSGLTLSLQISGGTKRDASAEQQQTAKERARQTSRCIPGVGQVEFTCICRPDLVCEDFCLLEMHALQQGEAGEAVHRAMGLWNAHGLPHTHLHTCTQDTPACARQQVPTYTATQPCRAAIGRACSKLSLCMQTMCSSTAL